MDILDRLLKYDSFAIQCHDNPDADALASGYALYLFLESHGKTVSLFYTGNRKITKANLTLMISKLEIPVEYLSELPPCDLLVYVDCQPGESNVTLLNTEKEFAVIDHHECDNQKLLSGKLTWIQSACGSNCTVLWQLFKRKKFKVNEFPLLPTAMYYGLYSDTSQFMELFHPLDKDMRDDLQYNRQIFYQLVNHNISVKEMMIISQALASYNYHSEYRFAILQAPSCDPNILGIISDLAIQVDEIDMCVTYAEDLDGYKLSVRSCIKETKANDLAEYLCENIGSGGGHISKAGGYIRKKRFFSVAEGEEFSEWLRLRMEHYQHRYDIIYATVHSLNIGDMELYIKRRLCLGIVKTMDFGKKGMPIVVRTLEGDIECAVDEELYLMIGIQGQVRPIRKESFHRAYDIVEEPVEIQFQYSPSVHNIITGEMYELTRYMKPCKAKMASHSYAQKIKRHVKIFTQWDSTQYIKGVPGDYMVVTPEDMHDITIMEAPLFERCYQKVGILLA